MLGDKKEKLPPNSVQIKNTKQKEMVPEDDTSEPINPTQTVPENATSKSIPNNTAYVTHDEEGKKPSRHHVSRKSKRVMAQQIQNGRMAFLVAHETAAIPDLTIKSKNITRGLSGAKIYLQLDEWAYELLLAGTVIDEDTGE